LLEIENQILDISEIEVLASKICDNLKLGDVLFLKGELGSGKTTFSRFIINKLHLLNNFSKPSSINSPTYPILLTYDLSSFQIFHYDLFRIKNIIELEELDFFENIKNAITLVEWPELLIELPFKQKHYLINLDLLSENKRKVNINYFE
tara:strand:- start:1900 stop:2346 length:447 start_codon:yes stop_codon:yes gene_type:complete